MMRQEASYIRVLHASPGASGVDVYANGNLIARNLRYRNFTPYLKVTPGAYNIRVYRFGTTTNPIVSTNVTLNPGAIYTAAAIGRPVNIGLFLISDTRVPVSQSRANVRFIHLSPDSPALDITLPDGRILFSNVGYRGVTNYIPLNPGRYTIQARLAGTNNVILRVPNIVIRPGLNLSIYAVGLSKGTPKLQVLIPLDGSTYLPV
jgi:hypothetical protein